KPRRRRRFWGVGAHSKPVTAGGDRKRNLGPEALEASAGRKAPDVVRIGVAWTIEPAIERKARAVAGQLKRLLGLVREAVLGADRVGQSLHPLAQAFLQSLTGTAGFLLLPHGGELGEDLVRDRVGADGHACGGHLARLVPAQEGSGAG